MFVGSYIGYLFYIRPNLLKFEIGTKFKTQAYRYLFFQKCFYAKTLQQLHEAIIFYLMILFGQSGQQRSSSLKTVRFILFFQCPQGWSLGSPFSVIPTSMPTVGERRKTTKNQHLLQMTFFYTFQRKTSCFKSCRKQCEFRAACIFSITVKLHASFDSVTPVQNVTVM